MFGIIKRITQSGRFRKIYEKYVYLKMCYGRFGVYLSIPKDLLDDFVRYGTLLAVIGFKHWGYMIIVGCAYGIFRIWFGHVDYKLRLPQLETSVGNSYNPDLMEIKRGVKKYVKSRKKQSKSN